MNSKIFFTLAILIIGLIACNNNTADPEFNYQNIVTADSTDAAKSKLTPDTAINKIQPVITTAPATSNTTTTTAGLNPEHGKPGHRCDIAVGAPLNSKPVTTSSSQQIQTQTVSTNKTVTKPGMNPPHGEPGHRCDIAVGSPLNQALKPAPEQNIKTVSPIINDSIKK